MTRATKKIGDVCQLVNGRAFKPSDWTKEGLRIIRIQNLNNEDAPFNCYNGNFLPKHLVADGDVLLSWSGTPGTSFGCFIWNRGEAILNQHIFKVHVNEDVYDKEYFKFAVNSELGEMIHQAHGAVGLRHITKGRLEAMAIPYAPKKEQLRIVGRLKECLARIEEMHQLREGMSLEADALPTSTFNEFWQKGEITDAPKVSLDSLGAITTGNTPSRKVPDYFAETGTPWITPGDMNSAKEITTGREFLSPRGIAEARARVLAANSVAVCCIGATIGKVAIVRQPTGINQQINAVTFDSRVLPDYGYWACRALYPEILANAAQATLPILNKSRFGELTIPVPDKKVQQRIADKLDEVLEASIKMKELAVELAKDEEALREAVLREAFAGNL